jgi:hypothetical protein
MHGRYCRLHRIVEQDGLTVGMLDHQANAFGVGHQPIKPLQLLIAVTPFFNPENLIPMDLSGRNQTGDPQHFFYSLTIALHLLCLVSHAKATVERVKGGATGSMMAVKGGLNEVRGGAGEEGVWGEHRDRSSKGHRKYQITVFEYVGWVSTRQQGLVLPPLSD